MTPFEDGRRRGDGVVYQNRADCPSRAIQHPSISGSHNISAPRSATQLAAGQPLSAVVWADDVSALPSSWPGIMLAADQRGRNEMAQAKKITTSRSSCLRQCFRCSVHPPRPPVGGPLLAQGRPQQGRPLVGAQPGPFQGNCCPAWACCGSGVEACIVPLKARIEGPVDKRR